MAEEKKGTVSSAAEFVSGDINTLKFIDGADENKTISIDLTNEKDKDALWDWLKDHTANGAKVENIKVEIACLKCKNKQFVVSGEALICTKCKTEETRVKVVEAASPSDP